MKLRGLRSAFLMPIVFGLTLRAAADAPSGWQALANYRPAEALRVFDATLSRGGEAQTRDARLGRAIALLDLQPVDAAQLGEARGLLRGLAENGADECAAAARFFLGRIAQHHQPVPDPAEAARQYRLLLAQQPQSPWAQSALARLALLEIYELAPADRPATRIARAAALLDLAKLPSAQSDLHYLLANATLFFQLPAAGALPHLLAAERLGCLDWPTRIDVLVQIAELSRLAGDRTQATRFYRIFLTENPRDLRVYVVRERLAELEKSAGGAGAN